MAVTSRGRTRPLSPPMTTANIGYAFTISLPPSEDQELRRWTESTPGASWDMSGGHVTLARLTGSRPPQELVQVFQEACAGVGAFQVAFTEPVREGYWDKPGLEIVMLVGEKPEDVAKVLELRQRLLDAFLPAGLALMEGGEYVPHVTLTTGLPPEDAARLEGLATGIDLRFTVNEVVFWSGGESTGDAPADPPWHIVERLLLL